MALEQLASEESISGKEAVEEISDKIQACIRKQMDKIQKEKEERSFEIDRQAMMKTLTQRVQDSSDCVGKDNN